MRNPEWHGTFEPAWNALLHQYRLVLTSDGWAELQRNAPGKEGLTHIPGFPQNTRVPGASFLKDACLCVAENLGLSVVTCSFEGMPYPTAKGGLNQHGRLFLNRAYPDDVHVFTLFHEMAHHVIGHLARKVPRSQGEVEAEAVSAILAHALCPGVGHGYSAAYVAWFTKGQVKRLHRRKVRVSKAAEKLYGLLRVKL